MDFVLKRLSLALDYLRSVVCRSWCHVAQDNSASVKSLSPTLLMIYDKEDTWNLYNVMEDKVLDMQLRLPNKRFCGSSKGWLVAVEQNFAVTLQNPFYRVKEREEQESSIIRLPPLSPPDWYSFKRCDYFVHKATISADPILNANKCIVVVIYEDRCQLAFIGLKDTRWTYVDERWHAIEEVVRVEDNFYAVNNWSQLLRFDITRLSSSDVTVTAKGIARKYVFRSYLVDSNEGLLMVQRILEWEVDKCVTKKFKVFELNCNKSEWVEKKALGDIALFVGDNSSVSVLASNFRQCEPNCIYFNQDNNRIKSEIGPYGPHDFGVYNVQSEKISKPYTTHAMTLLKMTKQPPIWVTPTFSL